MFGKKKIFASLAVGLVLSGVALYFSFRNIPLGELVVYLRTVNYWWVIPSVCATLIAFVVRVIRWRLLLSPFKKTGFWNAFHPLMIGFSLNCLLPARVGELARPAIFFKKENVSFSKVLATVGAERVFDIVVLLISFVVVLVTVDIAPDLDTSFGAYHLNKATLDTIAETTLKLSLILVLGIVLISVEATRRGIKQLILASPRLLFFAGHAIKERIKQGICVRLTCFIDNLAAGLDLLKSPKKLSLCFFLSLLVWAFSGVAYYVLSFGCPGFTLSFLEIYAVMVIICFFISLPSVPGFWGLWEAGGVFGLSIFGVAAKEAAGFTLANHFFQLVPVIIVGLASSVITGVSLVQIAHEGNVGTICGEKMRSEP